MSVATTGRRLDRFLTDLSALVEVLPSPDAKARMDADLASLIEFLQNFRARLHSLPTDDGAEQIASTIESVKDFVRIAESDPTMCRVLGLAERSRSNGQPRRPPTNAGGWDASKALDELKGMPSQEVERILADRRKYNVAALRAIGAQLGLRIPSRASRLSIAEKVTKALANRRGYQYLREGADQMLASARRVDGNVESTKGRGTATK